MQIVQELCKRPGLNKCGFDMPTIYLPNPNKVSGQQVWRQAEWGGKCAERQLLQKEKYVECTEVEPTKAAKSKRGALWV